MASCPRPVASLAMCRALLLRWLPEEFHRVEPEASGNPFDGLKRQVPLASLQAPNVGLVVAQLVGELLLAEPVSFTIGPEIEADPSLQFPFGHPCTCCGCYLRPSL